MENSFIKPEIQILLSSYNGERYIGEQLDSILSQRDVCVHCLIRDDGSSDNTSKILRKYKGENLKRVSLMLEKNIGFAKSFFSLVENSGDYKYFSFSDQDDVWLPEKLKVAISHVNGESSVPEMYFCNCLIVDSSLNILGPAYDESVKLPEEKHKRILENLATGCTIVFNRAARDMFVKADAEKIEYHDLWMYVLCSYFGNVIYDSAPHILYRQHEGNVIGSKPNLVKLWKSRIRQLEKKTHLRENIAYELLRLYASKMSDTESQQVELLSNYRKSLIDRIKLLFACNMKLPTKNKNLWFKIHILVGNV